MDRLLTQQEGANRVGVSIETIQRYIDYGILDSVTDGNNRKIRVEDLDSLFSQSGSSLNVELEHEYRKAQESPFFSNSKQDHYEDRNLKERLREDEESYDEHGNLASPHESLRLLREKIVRRGPVVSQIASGDSGVSRAHLQSKIIYHHNTQGFVFPASPTQASTSSPAPSPSVSKQDNDSLQNTSPTSSSPGSSLPVVTHYDLITINKRLREEIYELKKERDWLRERLEKVEARSEREQMLLLHESETVRTLLNERPKRPFWTALPWFGKS